MKTMDRVLEILSEDKKAMEFREKFLANMNEANGTEEEIAKAKELMLMIMIQNNKEAMDFMAKEAYKEFNK